MCKVRISEQNLTEAHYRVINSPVYEYGSASRLSCLTYLHLILYLGFITLSTNNVLF